VTVSGEAVREDKNQQTTKHELSMAYLMERTGWLRFDTTTQVFSFNTTNVYSKSLVFKGFPMQQDRNFQQMHSTHLNSICMLCDSLWSIFRPACSAELLGENRYFQHFSRILIFTAV